MKKILIVGESFASGGIESSLVNMANELVTFCNVDLFMFDPVGVMRKRLDTRINILDPSWRIRTIGSPFTRVIRSWKSRYIVFRIFATVWTKIFNNKLPISIALKNQPLLENYDLAIAFRHEKKKKSVSSGYVRFVDKCVKANKKVAWLHYDGAILDLDSKFNNPFYQKMDKVFCVSKSLVERFAQRNQDLKNKLDYCYNFMPFELIRQKSLESQAVEFKGDLICFTACRLSKEKGLERAIKSLAEFFYSNKGLMWYIAGDGPERNNIEKLLFELRLKEQIILLGNQENPYTYMRNADITMLLSYHEAAPMVYFESMSVGTPVFSTLTSSTREILTDGVNSIITENSVFGIKQGFKRIVENRRLISSLKYNLKEYKIDNSDSIRKISELLE